MEIDGPSFAFNKTDLFWPHDSPVREALLISQSTDEAERISLSKVMLLGGSSHGTEPRQSDCRVRALWLRHSAVYNVDFLICTLRTEEQKGYLRERCLVPLVICMPC